MVDRAGQRVDIQSLSSTVHENRLFWVDATLRLPHFSKDTFATLGLLGVDPSFPAQTLPDVLRARVFPTGQVGGLPARLAW